MPRAVESIEARILRYFRTAPLSTATLLVGLIKDAVRARHPAVAPKAATPVHAKPKVAHKAKRAKAKPRTVNATGPKKSHHKQAPTAAAADTPERRKGHRRGLPGSAVTEPAQVEDFGSEQ